MVGSRAEHIPPLSIKKRPGKMPPKTGVTHLVKLPWTLPSKNLLSPSWKGKYRPSVLALRCALRGERKVGPASKAGRNQVNRLTSLQVTTKSNAPKTTSPAPTYKSKSGPARIRSIVFEFSLPPV